MSRRALAPDLAKLRSCDALGLAKHNTIAIEQIASVKRRLLRHLDDDQRSTCEQALIRWEAVPEMIASIQAERQLDGDRWTSEHHRLLTALSRLVGHMLAADSSDNDDVFWAEYGKVANVHRAIQDHINNQPEEQPA